MLPQYKCELSKKIFDIIDKTVKADESYYLFPDSVNYKRLKFAITDTEQIYRFSDYGIQSGRDGISCTLKANMGTWKNRVPYIKDNFGIRKITLDECLVLQDFPKDFQFPKIPLNSIYKQCGNSVVVPVVRRIAENIATILQK